MLCAFVTQPAVAATACCPPAMSEQMRRLEGMGFSSEQAEDAARAVARSLGTGAGAGAGAGSADMNLLLDWLLINVPPDQLPARFTEGEGDEVHRRFIEGEGEKVHRR